MAGNGLTGPEMTGNGWKWLKCDDNDNEHSNYNDKESNGMALPGLQKRKKFRTQNSSNHHLSHKERMLEICSRCDKRP